MPSLYTIFDRHALPIYTMKNLMAKPVGFKNRFVPDHAALKDVIANLKQEGAKVVLTQGVYDLIHEGHARYLEAAKSYGDVLLVGVDSDELTKLRKGPNRPIVPQGERVTMLLHLRHVDLVTI